MSEYKDIKQSHKTQNRAHGAEELKKYGVYFTSHNNGAHLRVEDKGGGFLDYWPGTGKWKTFGGLEGRGIKSLLYYLGVKL